MSRRLHSWRPLMVAGSVLLTACALPPASPLTTSAASASAASSALDPMPRTVTVDGRSYLLSQLTASTWTVTAPGLFQPLTSSLDGKTALLRAIESASGCKVTDSDFSRQGMQLDAQVDCGGRFKN